MRCKTDACLAVDGRGAILPGTGRSLVYLLLIYLPFHIPTVNNLNPPNDRVKYYSVLQLNIQLLHC